MVHIRSEPSLSTPQAAQMPLCGTSACGLKTPHQVCVAGSDVPNRLGVEKHVIAKHSGIHDTPVHPDDLWVMDSLNGNIREVHYQVRTEYPTVITDPETDDLTALVFIEVSCHSQWNLQPSVDGCNGERSALQERLGGSPVESRRTIGTLRREALQLLTLEHIVGAVPRSLDERGRELGESFSSLEVSEHLELALGGGSVLEAEFEEEVATLIKLGYCICDCRVLVEYDRYSPLHIDRYISYGGYIAFGDVNYHPINWVA